MHPQRRRGRTVAASTALACAAFALAACGGADGSPEDEGPAASGDLSLSEMEADLATFADVVTDLPEVAPVPEAASLSGSSVWWVPLGPAVDAGIHGTLEQAFTALGIEMHTCDGKFLPTTVASCLEQAGNQGADAVITGYVDYKSIPTAFDALVDQGIPVLLAGAVNNSGREQSAQFAVADTTEILQRMTRTQLEVAITEGKGRADILWVAFDDSEQLSSITDYAESFVADNCPDCGFEILRTNSAALPKLASQAGAALAAEPDTDYVLVQVDPAAPSVIQAIEATGRETKVVGAGPTVDTLAKLQAGDGPLVATSGVSNAYESWAFAQSVVQMMTGTAPEEQVGSIYRLFTRDNVANLTVTPEAYGTVDWFADDAAVAASFTDAWGVS